MTADPTIYDGAAQLERTALSWNRTLLTFAANGVLLIKVAPDSGRWAALFGVVVLVVTLLAWLATSRTYRGHGHQPHIVMRKLHNRLQVATCAALTVGIADVGAILTYT